MYNYIYRVRLLLIVFLIVSFACSPDVTFAGWEQVSNEKIHGGWKDCLGLEFSNDIPYVVFLDAENDGISLMKLENGEWDYVGQPGFAGSWDYMVEALSLKFLNDTPYVYFRDNEYDGKATVMKFNGDNWISVGPRGFSDVTVAFGNLVINQGVLYVVFRDYYEEFNFRINVMKYDGTNWVYLGNPGISAPANFPSIFFFKDTAYISYMDNNIGSRASVKKFNGLDWVFVGNPGFNNYPILGEKINMAFCTSEPFEGIPFAALAHRNRDNMPSVTTVYKFENDQWDQVGNISNVDTLFGDHWNLNICFSGSTPYLSYLESGHPYVKRFNGTNWVNVGYPNSLPNSYSIDFKIHDDIPYLAYANYTEGGLFRFLDEPLSVRVENFSASLNKMGVQLDWTTSFEEQNSRFEIERCDEMKHWITLGSVKGSGTTIEQVSYTFTDRNLIAGKYKYRLKQIDFNGNFEYFELAEEVNIGIPEKYSLSQNYPNPFNPVTNLEFGISNLGFVSLKIYDVTGRELVTLVNEIKEPGYYKIQFNAADLSSGVYFYRMTAGDFVAVKKFVVLK